MSDSEIEQMVNSFAKDDAFNRVSRIEAIDICKKVRDAIRAETMARIAEKDAKIYAYEAIIANSNFKAVLPKKQEDKK